MAGNRMGITVEIGGDTTKLQTALKGVNTYAEPAEGCGEAASGDGSGGRYGNFAAPRQTAVLREHQRCGSDSRYCGGKQRMSLRSGGRYGFFQYLVFEILMRWSWRI